MRGLSSFFFETEYMYGDDAYCWVESDNSEKSSRIEREQQRITKMRTSPRYVQYLCWLRKVVRLQCCFSKSPRSAKSKGNRLFVHWIVPQSQGVVIGNNPHDTQLWTQKYISCPVTGPVPWS